MSFCNTAMVKVLVHISKFQVSNDKYKCNLHANKGCASASISELQEGGTGYMYNHLRPILLDSLSVGVKNLHKFVGHALDKFS